MLKLFVQTAFFCVLTLAYSCGNSQKSSQTTQSTKSVDTTFNTARLINKKYIQQTNSIAPPEYGGANYMVFTSDSMVNIKFGDIMNLCSYHIEGTKLKLYNRMLQESYDFDIKSKTEVVDKSGIIWKRED